MGFCKRCGDIVSTSRCSKCGGTAVAPVVQFAFPKNQITDKWSQTYITRDKSPPRPVSRGHLIASNTGTESLPSSIVDNESSSVYPTPPARRFSRPNIDASRPPAFSFNSRLSTHIALATSRPPSPLKHSTTLTEEGEQSCLDLAVQQDILPSPYAPELSKAYGSVLQPQQSLAKYSCAICSSEFPPDATIYPDPTSPSRNSRFLCRSCFTTNGGSRGECPLCHRPVLILKSEGGFVETSGRVWHKRCFCCEGCFKNIGDKPMVDLFGRPSCENCFESCLTRNNTPRKAPETPLSDKGAKASNLGGFKVDRQSREGSPAMDELEQRLGILRSREGSPATEDLSQRLNAVLNRTPTKGSPSAPGPLITLGYGGHHSVGSSSIIERGLGRTNESGEAELQRTKTSVAYENRGSLGERASPARVWGSPNQSVNTDQSEYVQVDRHYISEQRNGSAQQGDGPVTRRTSMDAIEEMKKRFLHQSPSSGPSESTVMPSMIPRLVRNSPARNSPSASPNATHPSHSQLRMKGSASSLTSDLNGDMSLPSTPDLISDFSDTLTQSSGPSSPPSTSLPVYRDDIFGDESPRSTQAELAGRLYQHDVGAQLRSLHSALPHKPIRPILTGLSIPSAGTSEQSLCAKCGGILFAPSSGNRFVTVPEPSSSGATPKVYHVDCFRCVVCDGPFRESGNGQAIFVRGQGGACHVECAPPDRIIIRSTAIASPVLPVFPLASQLVKSNVNAKESTSPSTYSSSRYERPPPSAPATKTSFGRFGSSTSCPGCYKAVSLMEKGVVPGPQGSRWHDSCLVCGGKGAGKGRREKTTPGCGKRLDSAAKGDQDNGVWCRECLLLLPANMRGSQQGSPMKPLVPSLTGRSVGGAFGSRGVLPQYTGTTTIAKQFTGLGGLEASLMRQLTGGGLSPTRQLAVSPTKQLLSGVKPRPKSVIGMRSGKSVDEGRGMFLVRQMTGGGMVSG